MKFVGFVVLLVLAGCRPSGEIHSDIDVGARDAATKSLLTDSGQAVVEADNEFAFRLFGKLMDAEPGTSLFISPLSVSLSLQMLLNGASGETASELREALGMSGMSVEEINAASGDMTRLLANLDSKVELSIANSLWDYKTLKLDPGFVRRLKDSYASEVHQISENDNGLKAINDWASEKTHGRIKQIIKQFPSTPMVLSLLNAVYFKGEWKTKFDPAMTHDLPFNTWSGSKDLRPMMNGSKLECRYAETKEYQVIELPYGEGRMGLVIVLPNEKIRLPKFLATLDGKKWTDMMKSLTSGKAGITIPRFKTEGFRALDNLLKSLGIHLVFDPGQADFTALGPRARVWVGETRQASWVSVNEEGTEAAAVTEVDVTTKAEDFEFSIFCDRPFFYAIRDTQTGVILFMGAYGG
jgi:serine protease inhibitor